MSGYARERPAGSGERCWRYSALADALLPDSLRLDHEPGPEAA